MLGPAKSRRLDQPITLITLDGDGTLWDFETAMRQALEQTAQVMALWGLHIDGHNPSLTDLLADREAVGREHGGEGLTMERLRWLAFERSMARAGLPDRSDRIDALYQRFMELRHDRVRLFDDALAALETLRKRRKLALITNGNTDVNRLGLAGMFDAVISAQACQFWKPDPRIFRLATSTLGVEPMHVVHVGDQQREDIEGARTAGMRAVWINRRSAPREAWCAPDAEIRDLSELPSVLDHLEQAGPTKCVNGANCRLPRG
jgi:FMN hydrolase / 5-amino-6-(5-phospho-D-ribitylamino)uracil phosphatase